MKPTIKLLLLLPISLLLIQSSCKKNKDDPKVTTYGPYQFAAKVNGQDFVASGDALNPAIVLQHLVSSIPGKFNLYIIAYRGNNSTIEIYVDDFKGVGTYSLNSFTYGYPLQTEPLSYGLYSNNSASTIAEWITNATEVGTITFTEATNGKIKCSFSFKAKNNRDGTTVDVTNGYFAKN